MCGDVGGEHGGDAVFHLAGAPGVLGSHACRVIAVLEVRGLVDRDPRPDQVTLVIGQPPGSQGRQLRPQVLPRPRIRPEQGLHPAPALVPGRLRQLPAVRPRPRRQRRHVPERHLYAAPLRQHPPQKGPDLRIYPRGGVADIFYAGPCGRVVVVLFHKLSNSSRPPQVTRQSCTSYVPPVRLSCTSDGLAGQRWAPLPVPDRMLPGAKVGTDFPVQLLIISEPDGERRLRVRLGVERPGERCVIPASSSSRRPLRATGTKASAVAVEPQCMVCMVMDLVASEQCDGRQRADLASLPMTG